jgi:hypothetical protein
MDRRCTGAATRRKRFDTQRDRNTQGRQHLEHGGVKREYRNHKRDNRVLQLTTREHERSRISTGRLRNNRTRNWKNLADWNWGEANWNRQAIADLESGVTRQWMHTCRGGSRQASNECKSN